MALAEQIDIITEFTQRLQVAVIGAEETTDKHEKWVEGTETETIPTANGPLKTLRGQIAEWRLSSDSSVQQVIDSYSLTFEQKMDQFDDDFVNYLLTIGFEPAVLYGPGILLDRRAQTVAFNGVTYYWGGALPYTTTGDFGTETNWLIAPIMGGVEIPQMSFASGGNIVRKTQSVLGADGEWYYWTGSFPKLVAPGSTVESAGGVGQNKFKLSSGVVPLRPLMKIVASSAGMLLDAGSFEYGATVTSETDALPHFGTGKLWRWGGVLPKVVDVGSEPLSSGGVGPSQWIEVSTAGGTNAGITISEIPPTGVALGHRWYCTSDGRTYIRYLDSDSVQWVEESPQGSVFEGLEPRINESLRRSYAEAGYNVVGTFLAGFTIVNANDVGIDETTGKAYSGPAGPAAAGTDPASGGFVDRSGELLRSTVYGSHVSLSLYYTLADNWSDPAVNAARIENVCAIAATRGAQVDMDIPLEISVTGLTTTARDTKKFSTCGCSLRTTVASSFYPVMDYRNHFGTVMLPFTARFAPASFVKAPYAIQSTLNFNTLLTKTPGSKTYYVVGNALTPVGGGDGLTMKTGFSQLQMALNMADCGEIILPAGYYNKEEAGFIAAAINRKIIIRSIGGKAIFSCSNKGLVWTQLGTSTVYQRTMALTTRLIDKKFTQVVNLKNGLFDDHFELTKVATLAECQATPGTFHVDGTNLVSVRLLDDRVPDDSLICFRDVQYVVNDSNSQSVIVLDGIIFEGWGVGPRFVGDGVLYARNCQFNYTSTPGSDGGLVAKGWRSYTERCGASRNANDGFNYHANGTYKSDAQEFQNFAYRNGSYIYGSPSTNKNASTIHDGCQIVRADCYYDGSLGPVVADVHANTQAYNIGVVAINSVMPNTDNQTERAFEYTGGATGYIDSCVGAGSQWALLTDASSGVFVRQSALSGTMVGGNYVRQF